MLPAANEGRSLLPIVHAADAGRVVRFAATELRAYLGQIAGAEFTVTGELPVAGPAVVVSADANGGDDGFERRFEGDRLILHGHQPRGALYAVYDLLEELGCRFLAPGVETVPVARDLRLPTVTRRVTPAFSLRNLFRTATFLKQEGDFDFLEPELTIPQLDWLAKRRFNHFAFYVDYYRLDLWEAHKGPILDALLDRGFTLEASFHSLHYFCPPDENHDFGRFGPSTYRLNHPDWYLPAHELGRGTWQTRVELPAVRDVILERYLQYLQRNPELTIVGLWPDDIPMNTPTPGLEPSDGYLEFWNHAGREIAAAAPGKRVGTIAYFELIRPPKQLRPTANQHCWFCPLERHYQYPVTDDRNRHWLTPLKAWTKLLPPGQLGVFEYYGWATSFIPVRELAREDLAAYRELGVPGIYGWSGFTRDILGESGRWALDFYCLSHLLWDPDTPLRPLEEEWAAGLFGDAGEWTLACFDYLKDSHRREAELGIAYYFDWIGNYKWIDLPTFHGAQELLAEARKQAGEAAAGRLDALEIALGRSVTAKVERVNPEPPPLYWVDGKEPVEG